MKKVISYILLVVMMASFMPYQILAETTNVGVSITGSLSIDVVTTISADITLDLTTAKTSSTYMEIKNQSNVPVNAKITNISTTSTGAPSTFVGAHEKNWNSLSKEDTSTYVNFNILGEGQNVTAQDILANTELDLGTLDKKSDEETTCPTTGLCMIQVTSDTKIYEINANLGKNWDSGDKNFTYQIETVYSLADSYEDPTLAYTYPTPSDKITSIKPIALTNDLSSYNFYYEESKQELTGYYYIFEIDTEVLVGSALAESELVLKELNTNQFNAIKQLADGSGDKYHLNHVIILSDSSSSYTYSALLIPVTETSILSTGTNYTTLNVQLFKTDNTNGNADYNFESYGQEYNYTFIVKTIVSE